MQKQKQCIPLYFFIILFMDFPRGIFYSFFDLYCFFRMRSNRSTRHAHAFFFIKLGIFFLVAGSMVNSSRFSHPRTDINPTSFGFDRSSSLKSEKSSSYVSKFKSSSSMSGLCLLLLHE